MKFVINFFRDIRVARNMRRSINDARKVMFASVFASKKEYDIWHSGFNAGKNQVDEARNVQPQ